MEQVHLCTPHEFCTADLGFLDQLGLIGARVTNYINIMRKVSQGYVYRLLL